MSLYHVVGSRVLAQDEAVARWPELLESVAMPAPNTEPIGSGRPLSILVRHVYTGRYPKSGLGSRRDVLVTSAVRDVFTTFNAAPRAVNIVKRRIRSRTDIAGLHATEDGTPLVYYTPAVTSISTTATIEMAFDDYPDELVTRIAGAITSAGGIPLFGPYGAVMIGVGLAMKLVSGIANALSDARAEFGVSERLEFELPDGGPLVSGYRVLCESTFDPTPLQFKVGAGLVDQSGRPYDGDEPYIVLLLDGRAQDAYKEFTPTAATAALLERFMQQKEGSDLVIGAIVDAVKLYNDMRLRKEADRLQAALAALEQQDPERARIRKRIDALVANIGEQLLRPKTA